MLWLAFSSLFPSPGSTHRSVFCQSVPLLLFPSIARMEDRDNAVPSLKEDTPGARNWKKPWPEAKKKLKWSGHQPLKSQILPITIGVLGRGLTLRWVSTGDHGPSQQLSATSRVILRQRLPAQPHRIPESQKLRDSLAAHSMMSLILV